VVRSILAAKVTVGHPAKAHARFVAAFAAPFDRIRAGFEAVP